MLLLNPVLELPSFLFVRTVVPAVILSQRSKRKGRGGPIGVAGGQKSVLVTLPGPDSEGTYGQTQPVNQAWSLGSTSYYALCVCSMLAVTSNAGLE